MILTKEIEVWINSPMLKYYRDLGYSDIKVGDKITVPILHLTKRSNYKIEVECDICGKEKLLSYNNYNVNISKYNLYCCSQKCCIIKSKKTCFEKYGDENYNNREKSKETCTKKYGVEHYLQTEYKNMY